MKAHPIFARFYTALERAVAEGEREYREETAGRAEGRVLEVGAGTGANLAFYRPDAKVMATEPEPNMLRRLARRARAERPGTLVVRAAAEALPFPDATFDRFHPFRMPNAWLAGPHVVGEAVPDDGGGAGPSVSPRLGPAEG